ncbi:hypothetical protein GS682_20515 [Nostoc sp. B(2019)]|nr:hypothetical protein [Nostoc sp. B(2019)]
MIIGSSEDSSNGSIIGTLVFAAFSQLPTYTNSSPCFSRVGNDATQTRLEVSAVPPFTCWGIFWQSPSPEKAQP